MHVKPVLGHRIFRHGTWEEAKFRDHPTVSFSLSIDDKNPAVAVTAIADTGAQCNVWGYKQFSAAGFRKCDLYPVSCCFRVADKRRVTMVGVFPGTFVGFSCDGRILKCRGMVYVSEAISGFYLSCDTMMDLGIIPRDFPAVGSFWLDDSDLDHSVNLSAIQDGKEPSSSIEHVSCSCPQRTSVPSRPDKLPFEPVSSNIAKMRQWLLDRYSSSTFNTCPHRPLQQMEGPPIEIHINDTAVPRVCHTPAPIPLHWQQQVREDILRDVALGILEEVPYGVPVTWCHRMVITRKQDGTPRRTVDLSPLNRYCRRESFYAESPFILARRVPGDTWKSVADAWNGYHSVH